MKRVCFLLLLLVPLLLNSCAASKIVTIHCDPSAAAIYVNEEYQGNGMVTYHIPSGMKWVSIYCTTDGVNFAGQRYYVKSLGKYVDIKLKENMSYSSSQNTLHP